jgi:hypothetical protein
MRGNVHQDGAVDGPGMPTRRKVEVIELLLLETVSVESVDIVQDHVLNSEI